MSPELSLACTMHKITYIFHVMSAGAEGYKSDKGSRVHLSYAGLENDLSNQDTREQCAALTLLFA